MNQTTNVEYRMHEECVTSKRYVMLDTCNVNSNVHAGRSEASGTSTTICSMSKMAFKHSIQFCCRCRSYTANTHSQASIVSLLSYRAVVSFARASVYGTAAGPDACVAERTH